MRGEDIQRVSFGAVAGGRSAFNGDWSGDRLDPGVFDSGHCCHVHRNGGALRVRAAGAGLAVPEKVTS